MLSQTALDGGMAIARPLQFHDTLPVSRRSLRVPRDGLILLGFVALILVITPRGFIGGGTDDGQYLEAARCWAAHGPRGPTDGKSVGGGKGVGGRVESGGG